MLARAYCPDRPQLPAIDDRIFPSWQTAEESCTANSCIPCPAEPLRACTKLPGDCASPVPSTHSSADRLGEGWSSRRKCAAKRKSTWALPAASKADSAVLSAL